MEYVLTPIVAMKFRFLSGLMLIACVCFLSSAFAAKPHILLVIVDDMGYADLGCYGGTAVKPPSIDKLAAEGMRFTSAYAGCCVCAPARSTLLTGFHMGHTSVRNNSGGISLTEEDIIIAQMLKPFGYRNTSTNCRG